MALSPSVKWKLRVGPEAVLTLVFALALPGVAGATIITVHPGDPGPPYMSGGVSITGTQPRSGNGSVDLSTGSFLAYEYPLFTGGAFGTWGDLQSLTYDSYVTGSNQFRPGFALRLNYYGQSNSFFVTANDTVQAANAWSTQDVLGDLFLQAADGLPLPFASFADIPANTPITGIHFRDVAYRGAPYLGFADNATLGFSNGSVTTFNFERAAAVPEPASTALLGIGFSLLAVYRRRRTLVRMP